MVNMHEHRFPGWDKHLDNAKKAKTAKGALNTIDGAVDATRVATWGRSFQYRWKEGFVGAIATLPIVVPIAAEALYLTVFKGSLASQFGGWEGIAATVVGGATELVGDALGLVAHAQGRVARRMKRQLRQVEKDSVEYKREELERRVREGEQISGKQYKELKKQASKKRRGLISTLLRAGELKARSGVIEIQERTRDVVDAVKGK